MRAVQEKICLVIPCYNESTRLRAEEFLVPRDGMYFLFVDDGSCDGTLQALRAMEGGNIQILNLPVNGGKAQAVRAGMLHLKTLSFFKEIDWVGFWDADLATDLAEVQRFLKYSTLFEQRVDAIFGSRIHRLGSDIRRSYARHILGRVFSTIAAILTKVKTYDSQCGAKIFRKELIPVAFSEPFVSKWIFDIEIILRLQNVFVVEYPLSHWVDIKGSKIKLFRDSITIIRDILKIRKIYG